MYNRGFNPPRRSRATRGKPASFKHTFGQKEVPLTQLMKGLGNEIDTIPIPSFNAGQSSPISIQGAEAIASYNWMDSKDPIMIVPGSPRIWRERPMPYAVARDTGTVFVDQNASRLASSPLLPMIAAVTHHAPGFPLSSVDFVTDRNGLRKLLGWATGGNRDTVRQTFQSPANKASRGTFRIDVELTGKQTILMERWEMATTERGGPGYEHEFESASTTPGEGCEGTTGHHRILTYDFGGLKMLVRFKVDACLPADKAGEPKIDLLDELVSGLQDLKVARPPTMEAIQVPNFGETRLSVISGGTLVPQSSLMELKTRSVQTVGHFDWEDAYPQLLLSQTPHLFLCVHQRGVFQEVRRKLLAELETEETARRAQEGLRKLRGVLGAIKDIVRGEGEGARLSLVCNDGGEILVYERAGKEGCLPKEVLARFRA